MKTSSGGSGDYRKTVTGHLDECQEATADQELSRRA
jgi:hypothetical protein